MWISKEMEKIQQKIEQEIEAEERAQEEKAAETQKTRRKKKEEEEYQRAKEEAAVRRRNAIRKKYENTDAIEKRYVDESSGEEMPLYFQEPKQLLEIFTALEEQNLFLIQNSQETEQALEEVEQRFAETQRVMGGKAEKMADQIAVIEKHVSDENGRCAELRNTVFQK